MEQSAVELLAEKLLKKYQLKIDDYPEFAEAKQMEKEQKAEKYLEGFKDGQDSKADELTFFKSE